MKNKKLAKDAKMKGSGLKKKAQSTLEFLTLVTIVIAMLITIGVYFKRGLQGRWKQSVDDLADQYDPRAACTEIMQRLKSNTFTDVKAIKVDNGFWTIRKDTTESIETKQGKQTIGAY